MEKVKTLVGQATPEQIEAWKREHGEVFAIEVDGRVCYLKKPGRKDLSYASFAGKNDPLKFNEVIINNCWLGGDDAIRTDDTLFLSIGGEIAQMIEVKEAQLKKL